MMGKIDFCLPSDLPPHFLYWVPPFPIGKACSKELQLFGTWSYWLENIFRGKRKNLAIKTCLIQNRRWKIDWMFELGHIVQFPVSRPHSKRCNPASLYPIEKASERNKMIAFVHRWPFTSDVDKIRIIFHWSLTYFRSNGLQENLRNVC